ncbi:MAG: hypothetical protein OEL57_10235 [Trichlorobacter sp.]|uniref:hypothetical protein n=1 Tax=Trichlorobacter sp. TaxID=2911007 RepID=UPI00255FA8B7|nr:hypothetical protein [Trichlorobacter sp.]MDK9718264.1 hypothetical protein [Trichlorobacter sp.]
MKLSVELVPERMPVVVGFAETAAKAAGLDASAAAMLALSTEELFLALCNSIPGAAITVRLHDRRYAADLLFQVPQPPDLRIFNITSRPDHDTEEGLAEMGLFLASRACDQFSIRQMALGGWEIMLRKERSYPAPVQQSQPYLAVQTWQLTTTPAPDAVKQFSTLIADCYAACQFPEEFTPPGRLLDKLASNEYGLILAQGQQGELAGGLIWHAGEGRIVECFGPYLAAPAEPEQLSIALCEKLTEQFGRSSRQGLVLYAPQQPPAAAGFEAAGSLAIPGGTIWTGYRMLAEEFGADAAVAAELMPFYTDWCSSMALARNIRSYHDDGETGNGLTLFATRLNRQIGMARLTPLLVGRDAEAVLEEHLHLLDQEQFSAIYCTVDTGRPFDALLAPHLLHNGFSPLMLIPWGGTGDLILLQRNGGKR